MNSESVSERVQKLQLLLLDVDGVLTDGGIILAGSDLEAKKFDVQDGMGITLAQKAGIEVGIITGRQSEVVKRRAEELNLEEVHQSPESKLQVLETILARKNYSMDGISYMGDDVQDLPVLGEVGLSIAPGNARPRVKKYCDLVTESPGGGGAVREAIDTILEYRNEKEATLRSMGLLSDE